MYKLAKEIKLRSIEQIPDQNTDTTKYIHYCCQASEFHADLTKIEQE